MKQNFAGIEDQYANDEAAVYLQSIPYDGTSTWGKGADKGFPAFLEAAENMELYDIETDSEVYQKGIHLLEPLRESASPERVFKAVHQKVSQLLKQERFLTFFGGEHSISIGIIKAFYEKYPQLSVLQIDAHADLRPSYEGSPYNHACALYDASQNTNLVQVGIRSMDASEKEFMNKEQCWFDHQLHENDEWMQASINQLADPVYLTIDLDAFDPGIMPATGTPEPGGLKWNQTLKYLKMLFAQRQVVGFDLVELAPIDALHGPNFLAAKLYYKLLSYKFHYDK